MLLSGLQHMHGRGALVGIPEQLAPVAGHLDIQLYTGLCLIQKPIAQYLQR